MPYFLLCRAIELELKSQHLQVSNQEQVKKKFAHSILKAYNALPKDQRVLCQAEFDVLSAASKIYEGKGFEYIQPVSAAHGFSDFPDLAELDAVARKLLGLSVHPSR